ncbi:MAG: 50S ribosomal protein L1 [Salinispira sp.]
MRHGKHYRNTLKEYDKDKRYSPQEAVRLLKTVAFAKFDETVEIAIRLNVKKSMTIRDTLVLPHQFRTEKKILVFAKGEKAKEAMDAGAVYVGDDDLIKKIKEGWLDFDVAVATPDMMKDVGKLGQILGRRGLMPNPKTQTVTLNVSSAINELKKGRVEFRSDKTGVIHLAVGKVSMSENDLLVNIQTVISEVNRKRPPETKGDFLKSLAVSSTMGPGIKLVHLDEDGK